METPPRTGSEAFDRTRIETEHPGDSDLHSHQDASFRFGIDPQDDLPVVQAGSWGDALVPALSPETFVCMEDASQYVLRDASRRIVATFAPAEVHWRGDGAPVISRVTALSRLDPHGQSGMSLLFPLRLAIGALLEGGDVVLEPLRPKCAHYARQLNDFPGDREHRMMLRQCTAKRTDNGEFESLQNCQQHACELRAPRDIESEKLLRAFDEKTVLAGRQRDKVHTFDVGAELRQTGSRAREEALEDPVTGGGIFDGNAG